MKKIILYFALAISISGLLFMQSCTEGFEDMNRHPKNPTQASIPAVFNSVVSKLMLGGQEQAALHNGQYYFQNQQLGNAITAYPITGAANDVWRDYYYSLKNVRMLEKMLAESDQPTDHAKAMLDIVFAYRTLRVVNYFGDMPFSEAGRGGEGDAFYRVKYDNHKDIYYTCLDMLKSAADVLADVPATGQFSYGAGDVLFGNVIEKWQKFANSIRLRYAMQISGVDATKAAAIVGEVLDNPAKYPVIQPAAAEARDESIGMWLKDLANLLVNENREWSFRQENFSCLGTTMWELMSDNDNTDGSGIFDPRCYVFFEPNNAGEWKAYPQNPNEGTPAQAGTPYKDNAKAPDGRDYGQTLADWNSKGANCLYSPVNFYLVRDVDYIPELFITAAEVKFLTAEAYNRGIGVDKNAAAAKTAYEEGIRASINFWYYLVNSDAGTTQWLFGPVNDHKAATVIASNTSAYLAKVPYDGNETVALKQIYQQIWIDAFRQPWVAFDLYRRTLATPHNTLGNYDDNKYNFYKMPYPENERVNNGANFQAATGGNNATDKPLFWHKLP